MKTIKCFFATLTLLYLFIACNKSDKTVNTKKDNDKLYPVSFSVGGFSQSITTLSSAVQSTQSAISSDSLKKIVKYLECMIVPENSTGRYHIFQSDTSSNFGVLTDSLTYGEYKAYFIAYDTLKEITDRDGTDIIVPSFAVDPFSSDKLTIPFAVFPVHSDLYYMDNDFFLGSYSFIVDGTTHISQQINMNRIMGLLKLNILDAAANQNVSFKVTVSAIGEDYDFNSSSITPASLYVNGIGEGDYNFYLKKTSAGNFEMYQNLLNTPFSLTITATIGSSVQTKVLNNIVCYSNQITTISGNFFSSSNSDLSPSFMVNINPTWGSDTTKIKF